MRRGLLLGGALGVINTAVVVLLEWAMRRRGDFGWSGYAPAPRYADYLPAPHVVSGWSAVALVAAVLVGVNVLVLVADAAIRRRRSAIA